MNEITSKMEPVNLLPHMIAPDPMISMIERVCVDPNSSLEKLEKMMELKERHEHRQLAQVAREDRKAYFSAMAKCQSEMTIVKKNKTNTHTKSSYADLAAIEAQAMPIVHHNGFTVSFQPDGTDKNGDLVIKWTVAHESGHIETGVGSFPLDNAGANGTKNKTGIQAFGSTATYGRRYLLCMLFNISTGDDNDGNAEPKKEATISAAQYIELRDLLKKSGTDEAVFLKYYKVEHLQEMPVFRVEHCKNTLIDKITLKEANNGTA